MAGSGASIQRRIETTAQGIRQDASPKPSLACRCRETLVPTIRGVCAAIYGGLMFFQVPVKSESTTTKRAWLCITKWWYCRSRDTGKKESTNKQNVDTRISTINTTEETTTSILLYKIKRLLQYSSQRGPT